MSAATGADEHAAVWSGAVLRKMGAEQRDEFGVDGYWPGLPWCPVLEFAAFAGAAVVSPVRATARLGVREQHFSPSLLGEADEVVLAQFCGFLGA